MTDGEVTTLLPLFPLPNVVHFPGTDLRLHIFEPRYRQLIEDLQASDPDERLIGMVLTRPDAVPGDPNPEFFPGGCAGLLIDVDPLPDGRSNIILSGAYRFEVQREVSPAPYRRAEVVPLAEPPLDEDDSGVKAARDRLLELVAGLSSDLDESFPLTAEELFEEGHPSFEELVNRIAAGLDLPALRKVQLLNEPLPQRAVTLVKILGSRRKVIDLLSPFHHLAATPETN